MRKWAIAAMLVMVTGCGGSSGVATTTAGGSSTSATSTTSPSSATPSCIKPGDPGALITLATPAGPASAYDTGKGTTVVILSPEIDSDLCQLHPYAQTLAAGGYRAIVVSNPSNDAAVPQAAATYALAHGGRQLVFLGTSVGGTLSIIAAARQPAQVKAVIALSPPDTFFDLNAVTAITAIKAPVLLVAGADDADFAAHTEKLAKAAKSSPKVDKVIVAKSADHGAGFLASGSPVLPQVRRFLATYAPPTGGAS